MWINAANLQSFRNLKFCSLEFEKEKPTFFVGLNGQGKSNILEALGHVTALRSFRTHETLPMIRKGDKRASLYFEVETQNEDNDQILIELGRKKRRVSVNDQEMKRLSDYIGKYPTVVFSAEDIQLIKGGPQLRRRFMDLFLSVLDTEYFSALQRFHKVLKERNAALKNEQIAPELLNAYDPVMIPDGLLIHQKRLQWMTRIAVCFETGYKHLAHDADVGGLTYKPKTCPTSHEEYQDLLDQNRAREIALGSTVVGPHRDDYLFTLNEMDAAAHASEGQQRSLVLALKYTQIQLIPEIRKERPVILMDDILGELDRYRRERFWSLFGEDHQIIATGTELPEVDNVYQWKVYNVNDGSIS